MTEISREKVTIDEKNTYDIDENVESFLTYRPTQASRILQRKGQYVHVGLEERRVVWLGGIGEVIESEGRRVTFYIGTTKSVNGRRVIFTDGTLLRLGGDVTSPELNARMKVTIDVTSDRVVEIEEA